MTSQAEVLSSFLGFEFSSWAHAEISPWVVFVAPGSLQLPLLRSLLFVTSLNVDAVDKVREIPWLVQTFPACGCFPALVSVVSVGVTQVIVMGATNRPQDLDSAIMRRMPTRFHINQPALKQREAILKLILRNENVDRHVDLLQVAKETDGFSGSDLKEMCRDAALLCVREYVNNACEEDVHDEDGIRPMQQQDLHRAIEKMRKSKDVSMQNLAMEIVFD